MCGITGYIGRGNRDVLEKMVTSIKHRGPDDEGFFVMDGVGLGHTRLSIIDTGTRGRQPMKDKEGTVAVIFNGEIYNFKVLREELEKEYEFQTKTDTEVIIYAYKKYGEACFKKLNGMFAIAIYDFVQQKLLLARDRIGKKPLYWGTFENSFIFGSELKTLLKHPYVKKEINPDSLDKYLLYEYVPTPHTIFKNIYKLESGTFLTYQKNNIKKESFWGINKKENKMSFGEASKKLDHLLEESVSSRLISDVGLGVFLSGGIDSSAIAYYAQKNSTEKIRTFSVAFQEKSFDESNHAKKVAEYLGTDHHVFSVTSREILDEIPRIFESLDEPFADASIIPTYILSAHTKKYITVALGGDGGDELFAGYPTFEAERLLKAYESLPQFARRGIEKSVALLPAREKNFSFEFKLKKFLEGADVDRKYRHAHWLGSFGNEEKQKLLTNDFQNRVNTKKEYEDLDRYWNEWGDRDFYNGLLYLYMRTYLMDGVLVKVDRASMAHGLEVRTPLLDYNLVNFAFSLPYEWKFHGSTTKYIFKKVMEGKLPKSIINREKKGFGIPIAKWLKEELRFLMEDVLSKERIEREEFFDYEYVKKLKEEHLKGVKDNRKKLWTLMAFGMWYDTFN